MHWKVLLVVVIVLWVYVVIGGIAFHFLEAPAEDQTRIDISAIVDQFLQNNTCVSKEMFISVVKMVISAYDAGVVVGNTSSPTNWDYHSAIFFATTVVTTIGYGNISPSTSRGQIFCVFFAMLGIPLFLVTASGIGEKLNAAVKKLDDKVSCKSLKLKPKLAKALRSTFIMLAGGILFMFIPAIIFISVEDWSYGDALYYTYITLTTIGFGDFVAGSEASDYRGWYRLCVSVWIVIGLAWMAAVIASVQESFTGCLEKVQDKVTKHTDDESKEEEDTHRDSRHNSRISLSGRTKDVNSVASL